MHPLTAGGHAPAIAMTLNAKGGSGRMDSQSETLIAFTKGDHGQDSWDTSPTLRKGGDGGGQQVAIAFDNRQDPVSGAAVGAVGAVGAKDNGKGVMAQNAVRRLMPVECERLQGFPDDFTLVPWRKGMAPDGPRYKAVGNSMHTGTVLWLGYRIAMVSKIDKEKA
jgi:DNA (cytosine-5)-methyltransferase 1